MSLSPIGSVASNLQKHSAESISDYDRLRREAIEAKLYYLRDSNTPEEFDYIVNAELRCGSRGEFGLPAKELFKCLRDCLRRTFGRKKKATKTIYEHIYVPMSDEEIRSHAVGAARHIYVEEQQRAAAEIRQAEDRQMQSVAAARRAWNNQGR